MMSSVSELSVLWSVGILAIIVTVNAKGTARIIISWVLTLMIIALCTFASSMKFNTFRQRFFDGDVAEAPVSAPLHPQTQQAPSSAPIQAPSGNVEQQTKEYIDAAQRLIGTALGCAGSITSFDIGTLTNIPDSQYEKEQSRALSLRNQSANISRQVKDLQPPPNLVNLNSELDKAAESLRLAGWAVHSYFSAENETDEKNYHEQFLRYGRASMNDLKQIQQELLRNR